nr:MAG: coat protein [Leviviridae sp.]
MPATAALTVNDGQASPAAHTFAVNGTTGTKATWLEKSAGVTIGYIRLDHEVRNAKSPTAADRVIVNIAMPTVATVDGSSKRVRLSSAQVVFNHSQESTLAERKDLVAYVINALSNAAVKPTLYDVEPFF